MKRRFNSTGRKSIASGHVSIRLVYPMEAGIERSFDADVSGLKELDLPGNARVYMEPYVTGSSSIMRFSFGTIDQVVAPADRSLGGLDLGGRILFRVKVVDESADVGKILAAANALRPLDEKVSEDQQRSILPVQSADLGEAIWKLEIANSARPTLVVSHRIPGLIEQLKSDPFVQGAIVPHAVRQILLCILDPERGEFSDDMDWVQDWKKWASEMLESPVDDDLDISQLEERVDDIIGRFSEWSRFVSKIDHARVDPSVIHD
jgi:hypothetical protein